jgi:hypothetical protein
MKLKLIFFVKFIVSSLILFTFKDPLLNIYALFLEQAIRILAPSYPYNPETGIFIQKASIIIIAFIALIVSTPKISVVKKIAVISAGVFVFFALDFFSIQFLIYPPHGHAADDSFALELYHTLKWMLPFFFWIITSYSLLRGISQVPGRAKK